MYLVYRAGVSSQESEFILTEKAVFRDEKPFLPEACLRLQMLQTAIAPEHGF